MERRIVVMHVTGGTTNNTNSSYSDDPWGCNDGGIAVWIAVGIILLVGFFAAGYAEYDYRDYHEAPPPPPRHGGSSSGIRNDAAYSYFVSIVLMIALVGACIMGLVAAGAQEQRMSSSSSSGDSRRFFYHSSSDGFERPQMV